MRHDIAGQRFGKLVARQRAECDKYNRSQWLCVCDCGKEKIISANHLRTGRVKSCGCLLVENKTNLTHGLSDRSEYAIWCGIKNPCLNPNVIGFVRYGGRGVKIAPEWKDDFSQFLSDMGPRPNPKSSVERIDTNGDYSPANCRWASPLEQVNNRRNTRFVEYKGIRMPLTEAVRKAGSLIHYEAAWTRISHGWTVETALETPRLHLSGNSKVLRDDPTRAERAAARLKQSLRHRARAA